MTSMRSLVGQSAALPPGDEKPARPGSVARAGNLPPRWTKCPGCGESLYVRRLERNLRVCPECDHHFRLSARERVAALLDPGSFAERDPRLSPEDPLEFVDSKPYPARIAENRRKTGEWEAAIYGTGTVGGYSLVVCALDFSFLGGSMGSVVGEKVTRAAELGRETHTPVLICSASGGARMQEGALALMQMAKTAAALAALAEAGVPCFSLLTDPTYGGVSASFAMLGDIILAEPGARIGFAGPQVIEQTVRRRLPEGFQTAESLLALGQIDLVTHRAEVRGTLRDLLAFHDRTRTSARGNETPPRPHPVPLATDRSAWDLVHLARHPDRPNLHEYVDLLFEGFLELHGDRTFRDDPAIVGGLALFRGRPVVVVGHRKGRGTRENLARNFGMPHPEGYRKALRLMRYAGRFGLPVLTFVDTPGAYPGPEAEERNQSEAIARNLFEMTRLPVPIVCTVVGEGGSGGALAIAAGDRVLMLHQAIYAVISPEGSATILFKDAAQAPRAAEMARLSAPDLHALGIVDEIVPEPGEGAHADPEGTAAVLGEAIWRHLAALDHLSPDELVAARYARFRAFGRFVDDGEAAWQSLPAA